MRAVAEATSGTDGPPAVPARRLERLSPREWELVHTTYAHHLESLDRNEEMGERRVQQLFTVASVLAVAVGLVADNGAGKEPTLWAASGAAIIVGLVGFLTVMRLAHRNIATTRLIDGITRVRREADEDETLRRLFAYSSYDRQPVRSQSKKPMKGGLVDVAGCATAAFVGIAVLCGILAGEPLADALLSWLAVGAGLASAIAAWLLEVFLVNRLYIDESNGT
jgi:hypothetical protein